MNFFEFNKSADASRLHAEIIASGLESAFEYVHVRSPSLTRVAMTDDVTPQQESTLSGVVDAHIMDLTEAMPMQWWDQEAKNPRASGDYKFIRAKIGKAAATSGWDQLSYQEKEIAARWFVVDATKRDEIYSTEEQVCLGVHFHKHSVESRAARYKVATSEIYNRLSRPQQTVIVGQVEGSALPKLYIQYGIEGTVEGDIPGLFDYLLGRENSPWEGSGLLQKSFVPSGISMEQLVDNVMNVLVSGIYDHWQFVN
jgi:hypothetical protein